MTGLDLLLEALSTSSPSPTSATAVRPDEADQDDERPFIILRKTASFRDYGLDNTLLMAKDTFNVECWADSREDSERLAEEAVAALTAAGLPPSDDEADGLDPVVYARCTVVVVEIFLVIDPLPDELTPG